MSKCIVYGLRSSGGGGIRYVGQTVVSEVRRFNKHIENAKCGVRSHLYNWMRSEMAAGNAIEMFVIDTNAVWSDTERRLIAFYRKHGAKLTNQTDGGDGTLGRKWNEEDRERIAAFMRGRKVPAEVIERREATAKARGSRRLSPESRAKQAATITGRKLKKESIEKRTATRRANGGYVATEAQRAKVSASIAAWWANRKGGDHAVAR